MGQCVPVGEGAAGHTLAVQGAETHRSWDLPWLLALPASCLKGYWGCKAGSGLGHQHPVPAAEIGMFSPE